MFALILYYISFYLEKLVTSADSPLSLPLSSFLQPLPAFSQSLLKEWKNSTCKSI